MSETTYVVPERALTTVAWYGGCYVLKSEIAAGHRPSSFVRMRHCFCCLMFNRLDFVAEAGASRKSVESWGTFCRLSGLKLSGGLPKGNAMADSVWRGSRSSAVCPLGGHMYANRK
jgi:hypothetical protein